MTTIKRFTPDYKMHAVRFEAFAREAEHGEYVRFDAHQQKVSALEAERDALAVENACLVSAITDHKNSTHFCERCGEDDPCATDDVCGVLRGIPDTDAAIAAIQAQGVEKLIKLKMEQLASMQPDTHAFGATAESQRAQINELQAFAANIREAK
ncbi:Uncharacterised protein [Serratia marcescens]|uniref:hypothetical protein n=1 Tax=Serratia TaxID=613 RepID=UPI000745567B|nr:hypothetical protein [Serratia marcescens]CUY43356.1 Uncharacterised protein [Serratia marcescens]CUY98366.1 Uncharacterised protein [Serratia marcescens]CUZ28366.1 Uncharacterised protein [Serratia marcescens]CVB62243.1 Uncharacterised protein [Serratia marcescens]CVD00734.1 Uncharacterised protein [Serratia marcescens]